MLVSIDIDARRLSDAGAAAIAETLPRLTGLSLRNGYGLSGIGSLAAAAAAAAAVGVQTPGAGAGAGANGRGGKRETIVKGKGSSVPPRRPRLPPQAVVESVPASAPVGHHRAAEEEQQQQQQQRQRWRHPVPVLPLRALSLCSLGPCAGLGNPSPEHFDEWRRLAEACSPVLRALTLTNVSAGQLPLCALTPFFKYPHVRAAGITATPATATASDTHVNSVIAGGGKGGVGGGGLTTTDEEGRSDGLEELTLATVSSKLAATVLRGVKRPVPLCFRGEGGAAFPGGPRPPLVGLKCLNLVVDDVTDALCSAIAEGCPNVREVRKKESKLST